MTSLKNTIEDIVVREARLQIEKLGNGIVQQIDLSDVVAYALNRLPPMYASTDRGWLQQRKRAHSEFGQRIRGAVQQAMIGVKRDPLRCVTPLIQDAIEHPAQALVKIRTTLDKPELKWKEVPCAVEDALTSIKHRESLDPQYFNANRRKVMEIRGYLHRSKAQSKSPTEKKLTLQPVEPRLDSFLEGQEFESYMLSASFRFINALENFVVAVAREQMQRLDAVLPRKVKLEDVVAYTLNRLPPMYATSLQGLQWQNQRAKLELGSEIVSTVVQALLTLSKTPRRLVGPLPFTRFEEEQEKALGELRAILCRNDITWRNVSSLIEEALELAKAEGANWRQQWQMLGQIYTNLALQPGDAEFSLTQSDSGDVLIVKAYSKQTFGVLVDNPRQVAKSTLDIFPSISYIELWWVPLLSFPITYTRIEMAADGVL